MECILCNKQYVGKADASLNIRLNNFFFFFKKKLGFTPCKAEQPLRGMELKEKKQKKDYRIQKKDVKKVDAIMACKYFQHESRNSNKHAKFTIIDQ